MEVPLASVTTTSSVPAGVAAVVAVSLLADTTLTDVAAVPIVTVAPATKPLPLIVTLVPPAVWPDVGVMEVTFGGAGALAGNDGLTDAPTSPTSITATRFAPNRLPPRTIKRRYALESFEASYVVHAGFGRANPARMTRPDASLLRARYGFETAQNPCKLALARQPGS